MPPFQFDLSDLISQVRRLRKAVDGVSLDLPFVSVSALPRATQEKG